MKKSASNYDLQVDIGKRIFLEYDQELLIRKFRLEADERHIYLNYLNTPCRINRKDGGVEEYIKGAWKECRSFSTVMTIYDLLCYHQGETAPTLAGQWCAVGTFVVTGVTETDTFTKKYAAMFDGHTEKLKAACEKLGGILQPRMAGADVTCLIPVTPFFPVLLQFWEGDEEFPPKLMLLWDRNTDKFMHFETTFYLQGDLLERLDERSQIRYDLLQRRLPAGKFLYRSIGGRCMTLNEMIYKRKSCRSFTNIPVDGAMLETIKAFPMKPLYPEIKVHWNIVPRNQVKCICPWTTPQLITIYSEETDGWLENVGFLFQQMELYLQSLGLGVCWLGMGRMNPKTASTVEGMQFVIMLAFGHPKGDQLRHDLKSFKRKALEQITDQLDPRLEPARIAPSAVNSQPWYFTHEGDSIHTYCSKKGSRLDAGIALAHLYVANEETFHFFKTENAPVMPGYDYIGSVTM